MHIWRMNRKQLIITKYDTSGILRYFVSLIHTYNEQHERVTDKHNTEKIYKQLKLPQKTAENSR